MVPYSEKMRAGKEISGRVDDNQEIHFNLCSGDYGESSNWRFQGVVGYVNLEPRRKPWDRDKT